MRLFIFSQIGWSECQHQNFYVSNLRIWLHTLIQVHFPSTFLLLSFPLYFWYYFYQRTWKWFCNGMFIIDFLSGGINISNRERKERERERLHCQIDSQFVGYLKATLTWFFRGYVLRKFDELHLIISLLKTPLLNAALCGQRKCVQSLLNAGADVTAKDVRKRKGWKIESWIGLWDRLWVYEEVARGKNEPLIFHLGALVIGLFFLPQLECCECHQYLSYIWECVNICSYYIILSLSFSFSHISHPYWNFFN